MRRYQPAVKRRREQFATVLCERFRVCHPSSGRKRNRGSLSTPPNPLLRSRRHASVSMVAARRNRASGQPSSHLPGPPAAMCTAPQLGLIPAPEAGVGGRERFSYRTSAFSCSFSNLLPNSRSMRSPISCHVCPAAFISLRTASAFANERSAMPTASGWAVPNALAISPPNEFWSSFGFTEAMTRAGILFIRRGRAQ